MIVGSPFLHAQNVAKGLDLSVSEMTVASRSNLLRSLKMLFVFINIVQLFPATKRYYRFLPCSSTCLQIFGNTPGTSRFGCKIQRFSFE